MKTLFAAALLCLPLAAAEMAFDFAPAATEVRYTLEGNLHNVHGTFKMKHGQVTFDSVTGAASGELVIDATSGESGSNARDSRMHKSVLDSARYPEIVFKPRRVEGAVAPLGPSDIKVHGIFRIHGADHELVLAMHIETQPTRVTAATTFTVPYVQWGMKNPSNFIAKVKDTVRISITATAQNISSR